MSEDLGESLLKLRLEPDDIVIVNGRTVDPRQLSLMQNPPIMTKHVDGKFSKYLQAGCIVDAPVGPVRGNLIVAVYPPEGQSAKDCVYAMPKEELEKLFGRSK